MSALHAESFQFLEFDTSNMESTLQKGVEKLSLECEDSQCTAEESDESSQAGIIFSHLKDVESLRLTSTKSILKRALSEPQLVCTKKKSWKALPVPDLTRVRELSDVSVLLEEEEPMPIRRIKSCVTFNQVSLRFYDQCVGDHPNTSYGPPISLDWKFEEAEPISIDEYEEKRGKRRTLRQMMVNYYQRKAILMWSYGASEDDLKRATRDAGRVSFQRGVTRYFLPVSKLEEVVASVARKTKRVVLRTKESPVVR